MPRRRRKRKSRPPASTIYGYFGGNRHHIDPWESVRGACSAKFFAGPLARRCAEVPEPGHVHPTHHHRRRFRRFPAPAVESRSKLTRFRGDSRSRLTHPRSDGNDCLATIQRGGRDGFSGDDRQDSACVTRSREVHSIDCEVDGRFAQHGSQGCRAACKRPRAS